MNCVINNVYNSIKLVTKLLLRDYCHNKVFNHFAQPRVFVRSLRLMCYFYSIRASKCEGVCVVCVRRAPAEHTKHEYFSFLYNNFIYSDILGMESSRAKGPINVSHSSSSSSASYYEAIYSSCRIPYSQVSLLVFMHSVFFNFLSTLFHPLLLFDSTK